MSSPVFSLVIEFVYSFIELADLLWLSGWNNRTNSMSHSLCLLLSPTQFERSAIVSHLGGRKLEGALAQVCGFGPVAAAARTSSLISQHRPDMVILAGIAGSLDAQCSVGEAYEFHRVRSYGIGVGDGEQFQSAGEIGWRHVQEDSDTVPEGVGDVLQEIVEKRKLENRFGIDGELLSVCAASSSQSEADLKKKRYADALAEDMEGFAVATACVIHSVPWVIVRGISNNAGDRDKKNWQADRALQKTAERVSEILAGK